MPDEDAAIDWIISNQLGRRNLTPDQASYFRGTLYNRRKGRQGGDHRSKSQSATLIDTASEIAAAHGVHRATVIRDGKRAEAIRHPALAPRMPQARPALSNKRHLTRKNANPLRSLSYTFLRQTRRSVSRYGVTLQCRKRIKGNNHRHFLGVALESRLWRLTGSSPVRVAI